MIFLGMTFCADSSSFGVNSVLSPYFTVLNVGKCIADELYASNSIETSILSTWNGNTILHANFNGNLLAGNIAYYVAEVDKMRLKRRLKGEMTWQTLYEKLIETDSDFSFDWLDLTARGKTEYDYAVVPVVGSIEGVFFSSYIKSEFNGVFIADNTGIYGTDLEVKISEKRNKPRATVNPLNRKYPYTISNGVIDYDSGTLSGYFVEKVNGEYLTENSHVYRRNYKNFLNNNIPKLLKYEDGRMWLIQLSSPDIIDTEQSYWDFVITSFDWVEIDDCDNAEALALTGLVSI